MARRPERLRTHGYSGTRRDGTTIGRTATTTPGYEPPAATRPLCAVCAAPISAADESWPVSFVGTVHARCHADALALVVERTSGEGHTS